MVKSRTRCKTTKYEFNQRNFIIRSFLTKSDIYHIIVIVDLCCFSPCTHVRLSYVLKLLLT